MLSQLSISLSNSSWFDLVTVFFLHLPNGGWLPKLNSPLYVGKVSCSVSIYSCAETSQISSPVSLSHLDSWPLRYETLSHLWLLFLSLAHPMKNWGFLQLGAAPSPPSLPKHSSTGPHHSSLRVGLSTAASVSSSLLFFLQTSITLSVNTPLPSTTVFYLLLHSSTFLSLSFKALQVWLHF